MNATREIIAENIASLRRAAGLTQLELAEKLNYSDKAISKWERGDSIPDVLVLAEIAELFSVTVDYFLSVHGEDEPTPVIENNKRRTHLAISLTACLSPYVLAVAAFFYFYATSPDMPGLYRIFILPLPVVSVLGIIFSSLWDKSRFFLFGSVSLLLWSVILSVFVFISRMSSSGLIFVIGAPLQIIILIWLYVTVLKKRPFNGKNP